MNEKTIVQGVGVPNWSNMSNLRTPGLQGSPSGGIPSDNISGIQKKNYRTLNLALTNARTNTRFTMQGTVIQMVEGRNTAGGTPVASARVTIRFNEENADAIPFLPGQAIGGIPFNKIFISNDAQAGIECTLLVITDSPDNRIDVE